MITLNPKAQYFFSMHSDTCNLKVIQSSGGNKYFITFVDKCYYVYLLKSKNEAIEKFILFKNEVENQLSRKIKAIRNDRGGEYESLFAKTCAQFGIIHQTTASYSPHKFCGNPELINIVFIISFNVIFLRSATPFD